MMFRLSDYLDRYEVEDLMGVVYAIVAAGIAVGFFIWVSEAGRPS